MNGIQQQAEEILSLSNDRYFSIDAKEIVDLQSKTSRLYKLVPGKTLPRAELSHTPRVLAISMPEKIDIMERRDIPVLTSVMYSGQRDWEVEFLQNFWFIMREMNTGNVLLSRPFLWDKRAAIPQPSKSGAPVDETNAKATTTVVKRINVIKDLFPNSKWEPGIYHLTAIDYDWVSNPKMVELTNADRRYTQKIDDLDSRIAAFEQSKLHHSTGSTNAQKVKLETSTAQGQTACHVSLNLSDNEALFTKNAGTTYSLCTILLFKLDSNKPEKINLAVPVQASGGGGHTTYNADFSINLAKALEGEELEGEYQTYLVSGPLLAGPATINIH
jgi:hypothetical protein